MRIDRMIPEDIPEVVKIEEDCFSMPWSSGNFLESVQRTDTVFLVCRNENGRIQGYMGLYLSFEEGDITNVAVDRNVRRQGVGRALMEEAKRQAAERGVERIMLEVRESNVAAIELYRKMGFEPVGTRRNFYDFPKEDAILMSCNIGNE